MLRPAVAAILLLVATVSCLSQGMAVVVCRCSGDAFLGSAPESCCEDCGTDAEVALNGPADNACLSDCFLVIAQERATYLPTDGKLEAPAPVVAIAERWGEFGAGLAKQRRAGPGSGIDLHSPDPPGRPRASLHGSLRI